MDLADRIKSMLGQGLPSTVVASAVGCDPSYVSQLMEREDFKDEVLIARAQKAEKQVDRDNKWDQIEDAALDKALQTVHLITRPADLLRMAKMANEAKRRTTELASGSEGAAPTVNLTLPPGASIIFQMNSQAQVVEIDGRSTAPLPTQHLTKMVAARQAARDESGIVEVAVPRAIANERKKVDSILEAIGFSEEPVPVPNVMSQS